MSQELPFSDHLLILLMLYMVEIGMQPFQHNLIMFYLGDFSLYNHSKHKKLMSPSDSEYILDHHYTSMHFLF